MTAVLVALLAFQASNTLTPAETRAGWKLLFDGKSTQGWKNFKSDRIRPGWQAVNGTLAVVDPANAGDIVTDEKYRWFELVLEYNLGKGQNSGIMFHVGDAAATTWQSGPEIQLYDHPAGPGVQISGYLYELYGADVDASRPAGEWNRLRILVSPEKCFTEVNGARYYEYVLGSPDFLARVAKSKFSAYPQFAKLGEGRVAIQGDHGVVAFRNMKIRRIQP